MAGWQLNYVVFRMQARDWMRREPRVPRTRQHLCCAVEFGLGVKSGTTLVLWGIRKSLGRGRK